MVIVLSPRRSIYITPRNTCTSMLIITVALIFDYMWFKCNLVLLYGDVELDAGPKQNTAKKFISVTRTLILFFMGEGKFYTDKIFLLILKHWKINIKKYWKIVNIEKLRQALGLPRFFSKPDLVSKVFWKFQISSMPISTLMTILWGDVIRCFLKQNFLY